MAEPDAWLSSHSTEGTSLSVETLMEKKGKQDRRKVVEGREGSEEERENILTRPSYTCKEKRVRTEIKRKEERKD